MILFILGLLLFVFPELEDTVKKNFRMKSCILNLLQSWQELIQERAGLCLNSFSFEHFSPPSVVKSCLQPPLSFCFNNVLQ